MAKQRTSRLDWLVTARGWAMLGIFIGHILASLEGDHGHLAHDHTLLNAIGRYFDAILIPFFIVIIGAFYQKQPKMFFTYFKFKFSQRMLPVYFYMLLAIPLYFIIPPVGTTAVEAITKTPLYLLGIPWLNWPSWFLIALFVAELAFFFIFTITASKKKTLLLASFLFISGWLFNTFKFDHSALFIFSSIYMLHTLPIFLALLLFGQSIKKQIIGISRWSNSRVFILFFFSLAITVIANEFNSYSALSPDHPLHAAVPSHRISNLAGQYGMLLNYLLICVFGSIAFLCFAKLMPVTYLMRQCGDYSLVLIGLNGLFFNLFNTPLVGLYSDVTDNDALLLMFSCILGFTTLIASLYLAKLLDRLLPQLLGKPMLSGPILPALYRKK